MLLKNYVVKRNSRQKNKKSQKEKPRVLLAGFGIHFGKELRGSGV
jgi:hypothetical protein